MSGEGFTYCVPASWQRIDERSWRLPRGRLSWELGPTLPRVQSVFELPPATDRVDRPQIQVFKEIIGGVPVEMRTLTRGSGFSAFASWEVGRLFFMGGATDQTTADGFLEVYRTVRLTDAPGTETSR